MKKSIVPVLIFCVLASGCVEKGREKQTMGTILGGAGGAALGSLFGKGKGKLVGVAVGALAGSMIGGNIGRYMDDADREKAQRTAQHSLEKVPTNQMSSWHNPDTGHRGTFKPTKTFQTNTGRYCREYTSTVMIGGKEEQSYGTACRQPDGSWEILK